MSGQVKRVVIEMNLKALGRILQIPDGAEIVAVHQRIDTPFKVDILVNGTGFETDEGMVVQREKLVVEDIVAHKIEWPGV